jgi:hypothetical protein
LKPAAGWSPTHVAVDRTPRTAKVQAGELPRLDKLKHGVPWRLPA